MKNLEKGFIVSLLIIVVLVLVISGGVYIFFQKSSSSKNQNVKVNSSNITVTSPSAGDVWQEGNTYTISVKNLKDGVEYDMFLVDAQDKSRVVAMMDPDDFNRTARISSLSPNFNWKIPIIAWEGSAPASYKIYIVDVAKYQDAILNGNTNYPVEAESPAFNITGIGSGPGRLIVNKQMDNSNNAVTISWQFPQPTDAVLSADCRSEKITFFKQIENGYVECTRYEDVISRWSNQTGGSVTLNLSGNNKPIKVGFNLTLTKNGVNAGKWENFDVTFPAEKK